MADGKTLARLLSPTLEREPARELVGPAPQERQAMRANPGGGPVSPGDSGISCGSIWAPPRRVAGTATETKSLLAMPTSRRRPGGPPGIAPSREYNRARPNPTRSQQVPDLSAAPRGGAYPSDRSKSSSIPPGRDPSQSRGWQGSLTPRSRRLSCPPTPPSRWLSRTTRRSAS